MSSYSDTPSLVASVAVSPYRFVKITGRNLGAQVAGITEFAIGVADGSTKAFNSALNADVGDSINLQGGDVILVEAAAAIGVGVRVAPSANGRAQAAVATQFPYGFALEPAGGAGEIIRVYKMPTSASAIP